MKGKPETQSLVQQQPAAEFSREQVELLKRTVAKGATDDELRLFLALARRTGLDPFSKQIYAIQRWDARERRNVMTTQTSIDGLRLIADRTGKFQGELGPFWCAGDGAWRDVWLEEGPPAAAKVGVLKEGCREPFWGVARFAEYAQTDRDGNLAGLWRKMPATMVSKCAEANALRKSFPAEMSGLYSNEEMQQAGRDGDAPPAVSGPAAPEPPPKPAAKPELPPTKADASARPWTNFRGMINAFSKLHGRLGDDYDHVYRETLREFGVEHSNAFKDSGQAIACYNLLLERVEQVEAAVREGPKESDDFEPPEAIV